MAFVLVCIIFTEDKLHSTKSISSKLDGLCSRLHYLCRRLSPREGPTGFDSRLMRCVSMQSVVRRLFKLNFQKITGENNYALAA